MRCSGIGRCQGMLGGLQATRKAGQCLPQHVGFHDCRLYIDLGLAKQYRPAGYHHRNSRSPGHQGSCVGLAGRVAAGTIARGSAAGPAAGPVASGGATAAAGAVDIGVAGTRALVGHDGAAAAAVLGSQDLEGCCKVAPTAKETTTRCELACLLGIVQLVPHILNN